jgi:hypothetical protein
MLKTVAREWLHRVDKRGVVQRLRQNLGLFARNYSPKGIVFLIRTGTPAWQLAGEGITRGALQKQFELASFLVHVTRAKPKAVVEIGVARGATTRLLARLAAPDATIIGIDVNPPPWQGDEPPRLPGQHFIHIQGNSHEATTLERARKALPGETIDLLFIDGDHSYEGVKRDYELYSPLVRPAGLIAFHDINPDHRERAGVECPEDSGQVYLFWRELAGQIAPAAEWIERPGQSGYGIGLIRKPD